jgi:transposase
LDAVYPRNLESFARCFTATLNDVDPQAYFTDLLTRLVNGWPQNRIDELMPWHWATE